MEPVRAEQLNSIHPLQLPDIWRSLLTNRMMLTGRIGVSEELGTKELPLFNIHKSSLDKKGPRQCAKLQDLGDCDCDCHGGKVKSHPTS